MSDCRRSRLFLWGRAGTCIPEPEKSAFCMRLKPRIQDSRRSDNSIFPSRHNLQTCSERRFQRQSSLWDRHLIRGADLFHDALDKVVEDLQFTVEGFDELLIGLNPHDNFWKH